MKDRKVGLADWLRVSTNCCFDGDFICNYIYIYTYTQIPRQKYTDRGIFRSFSMPFLVAKIAISLAPQKCGASKVTSKVCHAIWGKHENFQIVAVIICKYMTNMYEYGSTPIINILYVNIRGWVFKTNEITIWLGENLYPFTNCDLGYRLSPRFLTYSQISIWWFPVIIHFRLGFSKKKHRADWDPPQLWKAPNILYIHIYIYSTYKYMERVWMCWINTG